MVKIRSKYTHPDCQFTCFKLDGVEFGISIKCVKEVIKCRDVRSLEDGPDFIEGVVKLRSMSVPVVDLRKRFAIKSKSFRHTRIIIVSVGGRITGFMVDEVRDIMAGGKKLKPKIKEGDENPWDSYVESVIETGAGPVRILDLARLFTPEELSQLDAPCKVA